MITQKEIKLKIKAVDNIKKVTRAMETISSIRFHQTKRSLINIRKYSHDFTFFLNSVYTHLNKLGGNVKKKLFFFGMRDSWASGRRLNFWIPDRSPVFQEDMSHFNFWMPDRGPA